MRDLLVTLIIFGSIPFILARPYIGILVWSWIGYMNPHRLTWGFAYDFEFAKIIGAVTLVGVLFSRDKKRFPWNALTASWLLWIFWMNLTTLFALVPERAAPEWDRAMKIQLISLVTVLIMQSRRRIEWLIWVIVLSLGFFGVKGGIFTILTGGNYRVWGPEGSFIEDNNALALSLIMTLPLMWYLVTRLDRKWLRRGMIAAMGLTAIAVVGTYSRGGMLASIAMATFLTLKSRHKLKVGLAVLVLAPVLFFSMPDSWHERMGTIRSYDQDASALGRINAWTFAYNLAVDRPLIGGGYNAFMPHLFQKYAPNPEDFHDAHSIYFEVLAEHGFGGLGCFLLLGFMAFRTGGWIIRQTRGHESLLWARDLAAMLQVSVIGYAVAGAFQGLAYFDLYYHVISLIVLLRLLTADELASLQQQHASPAEPSQPAGDRQGGRRAPAVLRPGPR